MITNPVPTPTTQDFLLSAWSFNWGAALICLIVLAAYLWRIRAGARTGFLALALTVYYLALASPIATLADGYLFSAHMTQHLLLQLVVPPLVLLSLPSGTFGASPVSGWLRPVAGTLRRPLLTWGWGVSAMWIWHAPALCNASVSNPIVHQFQFLTLLTLGGAFWWPIAGPRPDHRLSALPGIVYLFTACSACTALGIVLTFAPVGVCSVYLHPVDRLGILPLLRDGWGLTPTRDQQVGGLLMWVPACLVYFTGIMGQLLTWYAGKEAEEDLPALSSQPEEAAVGLDRSQSLPKETL
jgi:putative membrane protein